MLLLSAFVVVVVSWLLLLTRSVVADLLRAAVTKELLVDLKMRIML